MRYQELMITTDNMRLKDLYSKYADREEERITDLQSSLDNIKRPRVRGVVTPSTAHTPPTVDADDSGTDEEEFQ
jgi:hypothetical protein